MKDDFQFVISQLGARQRYDLPIKFLTDGLLKKFITDYWNFLGPKGKFLLGNSKNPLLLRSLDRWESGIESDLIITHPVTGIRFSYELSRVSESIKRSEVVLKYGKIFSKQIINDLRKIDHNAFLGFCSEALESLKFEKNNGNKTVLDQYDCANDEWIIEKESDLWPGWGMNFRRARQFYERVYEEWEYSDIIIVNSEWTKTNILKQGASENRILVIPIPYSKTSAQKKNFSLDATLNVLYVGSVSLRKGVQYLIEAAKYLDEKIKIRLIGSIDVSRDEIKKFPKNVELLGNLPYACVEEYYRRSDVFVFPTLSDGFGRVQLEAMSYGLPVITTPNCGQVVINEFNGFIVPIRDSIMIAKKLEWLQKNKEILIPMSKFATETINNYSNINYGNYLNF